MDATTLRKPAFVCGYQGESDYEWNGKRYSVRHSADDYREGAWNYGPEQYARERVATVGCLYCSYGITEFPPVALEVLFPGYVRARYNPETKSWEYADGKRPEVVRNERGDATIAKVWADTLAKYEAERAARLAELVAV